MDYNDLLKAHLKYGTTKEDIIKAMEYESILENVVIAPWWDHSIFLENDFKVVQENNKIYTISKNRVKFSFIEIKGIGAPVNAEYVLPLGLTKCKNIIFIGAAGSLDEKIKIGDIVIPEYSICGEGSSRYLNNNLEDEFGKKEYPSKSFNSEIMKVLDKKKIKYHYVPNFSTDSIFGEFYHLDKFIKMGCKTIEMETSNLFKCGSLIDANISAIFCISDNIVSNKSLFSGRLEEEKERKKFVKHNVIPNIIYEVFLRS